MYENWEKQTGENLKKLVNDKNFISEMAKNLAATMSGQASLKKSMDETLISMNLPTRGELVKALQKLTDIEEKVIDINEKLEDLQDERDDFKKLLASIDQRFNNIEKALVKNSASAGSKTSKPKALAKSKKV
jgi:predicted  nucleic acid-binding Zn-ribbon protein